MKITSAEFVMSNSDVAKCPKEPLPEYAFIETENRRRPLCRYGAQKPPGIEKRLNP